MAYVGIKLHAAGTVGVASKENGTTGTPSLVNQSLGISKIFTSISQSNHLDYQVTAVLAIQYHCVSHPLHRSTAVCHFL